jgi:ArsR family transcriptional regulator, arsenate/arsenite/antimonite-responsive transcriptional repressor
MKNTVKIFKSLSDETRLRILLLLLGHEELCICDLMSALDLPQSTVSRHVAYLKNAGWLKDRRGGVWMYYSVRKDLLPLHEALVPVIRAARFKVIIEDMKRLSSSKNNNSCA